MEPVQEAVCGNCRWDLGACLPGAGVSGPAVPDRRPPNQSPVLLRVPVRLTIRVFALGKLLHHEEQIRTGLRRQDRRHPNRLQFHIRALHLSHLCQELLPRVLLGHPGLRQLHGLP